MPTPPPGKRSATTVGQDRQIDDLLNILARSEDGVFAVDKRQRIIFWSAAAERLLHQTAAKVMGKYCYEVVLGRDYEGHPFCRRNCPAIRAARRGWGVPNFDIACRPNGEEIWLNVSIVPTPHSRASGPVATHLFRDVSKRRQSERLAQAAIDTVTQFMSDTAATEPEDKPYPAPGPALTARELEVLRLLVADGLGTRSLAIKLGLSEATVRNHIQRLLAKLGVHTRLEAVIYAARHGLA